MTELTAHRTLALRDALANDPDTAFLAVLHTDEREVPRRGKLHSGATNRPLNARFA